MARRARLQDAYLVGFGRVLPLTDHGHDLRHQILVEAKKPFLLYITTFVSSAAIGLYVFTAMGGMRVVQATRQIHQGIHRSITWIRTRAGCGWLATMSRDALSRLGIAGRNRRVHGRLLQCE